MPINVAYIRSSFYEEEKMIQETMLFMKSKRQLLS